MHNKTFTTSMVGVAAAVAVAGSAMAAVVDPFTVASSATNALGAATETPITGGLWDTRVTSVFYKAINASASIVVDANTNAVTFAVTRVGNPNTSNGQAAALEYFNYAGVTDVSNFTSLTFNYTSTFSSLTFTIDLDGKSATKTISSSAGGTFTLTAAELNGAFRGDGYMNLSFLQASSNASGTFTLTNLVANGVPAPGALALLGAAGLVGARRRRA
jgi:MYXO-CTERM domain-containing protein